MPSTRTLTDSAALPREVVQVRELPQGVECYFPPLRNRGAAAGFGAFGTLSIALPLAAAAGLGAADASGWLALVLVGGFALPVLIFGFVFLGLAAYLLGNSLTVEAGPDRIAVTRRVFGLGVYRRSTPCAEISAIEPQVPTHFQNQFGAEPRYRLIARSPKRKHATLVVAESLPGRAAMEQMGALIAAATGIAICKG